MTREITQEEFLATTPDALSSVGDHTFVILQNGEFVAALVSEDDYKIIRRTRTQRALRALRSLQDAIQASGATEEELLELEKALDRKAS